VGCEVATVAETLEMTLLVTESVMKGIGGAILAVNSEHSSLHSGFALLRLPKSCSRQHSLCGALWSTI